MEQSQTQTQTTQQQPKKRNCLKGCCITLVIIIILSILGITALVASTGLVHIPLFSSIFYKKPHPARVVSPDAQAKDKINKQLEDNVKAGKHEFDIKLSEGMLTQLLTEKKNQGFTEGQIAIDQGEMEFFGKIESRDLYITTKLKIIEVDNQPQFKLSGLKLGNLKIGVGLINTFSENLQKELSNALLNINGDFKVKKARLDQGQLVLTVQFIKELQPGESTDNMDIKYE